MCVLPVSGGIFSFFPKTNRRWIVHLQACVSIVAWDVLPFTLGCVNALSSGHGRSSKVTVTLGKP